MGATDPFHFYRLSLERELASDVATAKQRIYGKGLW